MAALMVVLKALGARIASRNKIGNLLGLVGSLANSSDSGSDEFSSNKSTSEKFGASHF